MTTKKRRVNSLWIAVALAIVLAAVVVLLAGCAGVPIPSQAEAAAGLQELLSRGVITQEQHDRALSTATLAVELLKLGGSSVVGAVGGYVATNARRNAMRRARGEAVAAVKRVS